MKKFLRKALYKLSQTKKEVLVFFRYRYYKMRGADIDGSTSFSKLGFSWPHKVSVGKRCNLESGIYFKYDGIYSEGIAIKIGDDVFIGNGVEFNIKFKITIGNDCLIAAGCRFVDHDHGIVLGEIMRTQPCPGASIFVGDDVWIGANVVVLKGVTIQKGAIVAAGAIVTKSIPPYEIWGGIPARKIGDRK